MKLLQLRTNLYPQIAEKVPFIVYTVGTEEQNSITRLKGFSAKQLFLTFSGTGYFRPLGQDKWDIITPNTLLYIPSGFPHEYLPQNQEPWCVGYVTYVEEQDNLLKGWGFGKSPVQLKLQEMDRLFRLIEQIWHHSGPQYDMWQSMELFFSFCVELRKQATPKSIPKPVIMEKALRYRDSVVDSAIRFLHDHLQRSLSMVELSSYVGYSPKQLNRLFQQSIGSTPLQYLQQIRLNTASLLLQEHPSMTIRQAAAYIGMEPDYFARLFRRRYGFVPSELRMQTGYSEA
ncbi:MAG TPA: helix-turn-helix domain-containing protein [Bacilli bacterium]